MYFETWKYVLRRSLASLARAYTPNTKELATLLPIPTEVITFFFGGGGLVCMLVSLFRRKMRTLFRRGFFFSGGGGGLFSSSFSAPLRKPKAPQCPPTEKILATPLTAPSKKKDKNGMGVRQSATVDENTQYTECIIVLKENIYEINIYFLLQDRMLWISDSLTTINTGLP